MGTLPNKAVIFPMCVCVCARVKASQRKATTLAPLFGILLL